MTTEKLLEYLFINVIEENGVYKTVINREAMDEEPQLSLFPLRIDWKKKVLTFSENGVEKTARLVQEVLLEGECITVIFSPEIGERLMKNKGRNEQMMVE